MGAYQINNGKLAMLKRYAERKLRKTYTKWVGSSDNSKRYFKGLNGKLLCVGDGRFLNNGIKRNIGGEIVANAHERSSSRAARWYNPLLATICCVNCGSICIRLFGALCSQLKFTSSVKFNYKLIMINNKHSCAWNWKKFLYSSGRPNKNNYRSSAAAIAIKWPTRNHI